MTPTAEAVGDDIIDGVYDVDFTQYNINPDSAPGIEEFVSLYEDKYGESPRSGHSLINYTGALAILNGLNNGDGFAGDDIRDAMTGIDI
ncbi:hypothetical protein ACT3RL_18160, partial [Halomonas sp. AOP5-CZ2-32]